MVKNLIVTVLIVLTAFGCQDKIQQNAHKTSALTIDEQITAIENRTDVPDDVKANLIQDLRNQQAAQEQANQSKTSN